MKTFIWLFEFFKKRIFLILWISLVLYLFYDSFIYYKNGPQFFHLRRILGLGLCVSRGTAIILNLCCALILLPLCKKLNQILYRVLARTCPTFFFFWLEKAKSFHMSVAATLLLFAVIHSVSHFLNLWNFSREYDDDFVEINVANYKNENPLRLLRTLAGFTGISMLIIIMCMGVTSLRIVRRLNYNIFWYMHQLYLVFIVLFIVHPLSGVLKQTVLLDASQYKNANLWSNMTFNDVKFVAIKSSTWMWLSVPLSCYCLDLFWRICSRNLAKVDILQVNHMYGRTIQLTLRCPYNGFTCRKGQYVLLQCLDISLLEWHPFTVVKIPTPSQKYFTLWIRIKGDWTESLEKFLLENKYGDIRILVDGPFSSPTEGASSNDIALCVAAGVGITPFVSMLHEMLLNPRGNFPGRLHLLWIVRFEEELRWLAELVNNTMLELRNANRPDRLHVEFYVTRLPENIGNNKSQVLVVNEMGETNLKNDYDLTNLTPYSHRRTDVKTKAFIRINNDITSNVNLKDVCSNKNIEIYNMRLKNTNIKLTNVESEEKETLLTPNRKRRVTETGQDEILNNKSKIANGNEIINKMKINNSTVTKDYPVIGCRIRRGRPHWDRVFGYWAFLYPRRHLNVYCCGPKDLVKLLRSRCINMSRKTSTKFTLIYERFS